MFEPVMDGAWEDEVVRTQLVDVLQALHGGLVDEGFAIFRK